MIVTFPLIVSKTVNPNILPGVCKALEKYVYLYVTDSVIEAANQNIKAQNKKDSKFISLKKIDGLLKLRLENCEEGKTIEDYLTEDWSEDFNDDYLEEKSKDLDQDVTSKETFDAAGVKTGSSVTKSPKQVRPDPPKKQTKDDYYDAGFQKAKGEYDQRQSQVVNEPPQFGRMDADSINTSPTWNTVTDQQGNTKAIGVKVVPFIIDNEQSLIKLMTLDRYRTKLSKDLHVQARKLLRYMHRLANATWKRSIGFLFSWTGFVDKDLVAGTITTNWKNDIILQNTSFKKNMFVLLNKMDLDDEFVKSAKGVKGLFKLGWTSFIIADDVNKVVNFCMEEYKGMCSMVNYGFLYADARTQSQVYTDIEDIKRSAGPLFRMTRRKKTMITDSLAQQKLDKYSQEVMFYESNLSESLLPDLFNKLKDNPKSIASELKSASSAIKRKDYKKANQILNKLNPSNKKMDVNKVIDKTIQSNPEYKKNYQLAYRVFKNSLPELDDQTLKLGAGLLSGVSTLNKNKNYNFKNDLKKVVLDTRSKNKTQDEDNDDFAKDLRIAFLFSAIGVLFLGTGITIILYALVMTMPVIGGVILNGLPMLTTIIVSGVILRIIAAVIGGDDE